MLITTFSPYLSTSTVIFLRKININKNSVNQQSTILNIRIKYCKSTNKVFFCVLFQMKTTDIGRILLNTNLFCSTQTGIMNNQQLIMSKKWSTNLQDCQPFSQHQQKVLREKIIIYCQTPSPVQNWEQTLLSPSNNKKKKNKNNKNNLTQLLVGQIVESL